jgi:Fic family protein
VRVRKKSLRDKTYYYLEHSIRKGKQVQKKELYLGTRIPKNIEKMKKEFLEEIYHEKWFADIEKIKKNFSKDWKATPRSAKEKAMQVFATKFTYDTQRIEGSTLTHRETADLLEKGITPKNKPMRDVREAEAHRDLFYEITQSQKEISLLAITEWHWRLFNKTAPDIAGKIRKHQVAISGSKFMPPSPVEVRPMLVEFFKWYDGGKKKINPVKIAALAHLKFVTIHPFADGNGRISRLIMNFILNKTGYPMLDITYLNRSSYYNALERSQTKNIEEIFLQWFVKRYIHEYKKYLK